MTLKYKGISNGMKIYTSEIVEDRIFAFSKHCKTCGKEVDILNNVEICWMSPDRKHHPQFFLIDMDGKYPETAEAQS